MMSSGGTTKYRSQWGRDPSMVLDTRAAPTSPRGRTKPRPPKDEMPTAVQQGSPARAGKHVSPRRAIAMGSNYSPWVNKATSPQSLALKEEYTRMKEAFLGATLEGEKSPPPKEEDDSNFGDVEVFSVAQTHDLGVASHARDPETLTLFTKPAEEAEQTIPFEAKHACMYRRAARQLKFGNPVFQGVNDNESLRTLGNMPLFAARALAAKSKRAHELAPSAYSFYDDVSPLFNKNHGQTKVHESHALKSDPTASMWSESDLSISTSTINTIGPTNSSALFEELRAASTNRADRVGGLHHTACVAYIKECDRLHIAPLPLLDYLNDKLLDRGGRHSKQMEEKQGQCHFIMPSYGVGDRGGIALAAFLQNLCFRLHELDLSNNGLRDESLGAIVEALHSTTDVARLVLSQNSFGPRSSRNLVELLSIPAGTGRLTELHLSDCKLRSHTVDELLSVISKGDTALHTIDLAMNDLSHSANGLSDLIEANLASLTDLNVSWGHLKGKEALPVALSLAKNSSIEYLNLSMNHFGQLKVIDALCTSLGENQVLKSLNLAHNVMTEASAHVVAHRLIKKKTALTALDISGNTLGEDGAKDLFYQMIRNTGQTIDLEMNHCAFEKGKMVGTAGKSVIVVENNSDSSGFSQDFPDGSYRLDLSLPHARLVAVQLQSLAFSHQSVPGRLCWRDVKYNRKSTHEVGFNPESFSSFKLPMCEMLVKKGDDVEIETCEDAELKIPNKGVLSFTYLMQKPRTAELLSAERAEWVEKLIVKTRAYDPRMAKTLLTAAAEGFSFKAEIARRLTTLFNDELETKTVAVKLFSVKLVDKANSAVLMDCLNELEQRQARRFLGTYFYFDQANATGHYYLDLTDRYDRLLAIEVTALNRQERRRVIREKRPDLSQYHNYEFLRNVYYYETEISSGKIIKTEALKYKNDYLLPSYGYFEFDYVSPIRPPDIAEALEADLFDTFLKKFVNLDMQALEAKTTSDAELKNIFESIDADGGGTLDCFEIRQAFVSLGHLLTVEEVQEMIDEVDQGTPKEKVEDDDAAKIENESAAAKGDDDDDDDDEADESEESGDGEIDFEEFRDLWKLFNIELAKKDQISILRNQSALHWFDCEQIKAILECFDTSEQRVEVYVIFYGRLLDEENMHVALEPMGGPIKASEPAKPTLKTDVAIEALNNDQSKPASPKLKSKAATPTAKKSNGGAAESPKAKAAAPGPPVLTAEEKMEMAVVEAYRTDWEIWNKKVYKPWLKMRNKELDQLKRRLGPLCMCNPIHLDGSYELNLREHEQRLVARILIRVAAAEGVGNVLSNEEYNGMGFSSTKWAETGEPPMLGTWRTTFTTHKRFLRMDVRMQISEEFLGWEFPDEDKDED